MSGLQNPDMKFKALEKLSVIDYPRKLCAIVFTGGCNFRCSYCHNPELVIGHEKLPDIDESEILDFMERRRGFLDGIYSLLMEICHM